VLVSLATFATVVLSSSSSISSSLSASAVFTTVSLLQLLIFPLNAYSWVFTGVLEAIVSKKRVEDFLFDRDAVEEVQSSRGAGFASAGATNGTSAALTLSGSYNFYPSSKADEGGEGKKGQDQAKGDADTSEKVAVPLLSTGTKQEETKGETAFTLDLFYEGHSISLPKGALVTITGRVGSGKTAALQAILGLMQPLINANSDSSTTTSTFSYASQSPWVLEGTIKQNITMSYGGDNDSTDIDEERYRAALRACCLEDDLATLRLGDATVLSSKNTTLSGGQLARVNLARALYCRDTKVLLADDACASLDQAVSLAVWRQAFLSFKGGKTNHNPLHAGREVIIAVTHDPRFVASSDLTIILESGKVVYFGPPSAAPSRLLVAAAEASTTAASAGTTAAGDGTAASSHTADGPIAAADGSTKETAVAASATDGDIDGDDANDNDKEHREYGVIKRRILSNYLKAVGMPLTIAVLVSLTLMQLSRNGSDWWLSLWAAADNDDPSKASGINAPLIRRLSQLGWADRQFLLVFGIIAAVNTLSTLLRSWSFAQAGLNACVKVHDRLLTALCYAPMSFHDAVPVGRLTNRLSADQFSTDESLPFMLNIFLAQGWGLAGTILVLCLSTSGLFLLAVPFLAVLYYRLQRTYRATSRELRRLDSTSRSPLFAHFSDSFAGSHIIWAQSIGRPSPTNALETACAQATALLDVNQTTSYVSGIASQWLGLRLQGIGALVLASVAFFAVGARIYLDPAAAVPLSGTLKDSPSSSPDFSGLAGIAGFALSYCIPVVAALEGLIGSLSETEKELVAVERAIEYCDLQPESSSLSPLLAEVEPSALVSVRPTLLLNSSSSSAVVVDSPLLPIASGVAWQSLVPRSSSSSSLFIHFDCVTLRYPGQDRPALRNFSLRVPAGSTVVVGGRSGAGKSSLLAILMGLVRPTSGRILLGDAETGQTIDAATIPLPVLRGQLVAMIPQHAFLLEGTVRGNLDPWAADHDDNDGEATKDRKKKPSGKKLAPAATGRNEDSQLLSALRACGLALGPGLTEEEGVATASSGEVDAPRPVSSIRLDDRVEAGGSNFSLGERQLLALSRTLVSAARSKPSILLVDEAASSTDDATDRLVEGVISSHPALRSCTKLIVAHRARTLLAAPLVAMLKDGELVEFGPPSRLLEEFPRGELAKVISASRERE
jgi:ATP-binding cassette, subfamily C (CFTR/MRP), member 10